jgi:hypothetical protein
MTGPWDAMSHKEESELSNFLGAGRRLRKFP